MNTFKNFALLGLVSMAVACGGGGAGQTKEVKNPSGIKDRSGNMVSKKAAAGFKTALDNFVAHEKAGDWSPANCKAVADKFEQASSEQKAAGGNELPEAIYNAGLS